MPQLNEAQRIESLRRLEVLDTPSDSVLDGLVEVAAAVCGVPISLITLIDTDRQWFKASTGLPGVTETARDVAFCHHTIQSDDLLEICDATLDSRFAANPLVTGSPDIRFYAGHSLKLGNGARIGTLCVIDSVPRQLKQRQRNILASLANAATKILENHRVHSDLLSSEARFRTLCETVPFGIFKADTEGSCTYTNRHMQEIFDKSDGSAYMQGWCESVHPDDREALINGWRGAINKKEEFGREFRTVRRDNSVRFTRIKTRPVTTIDGTLSGHVGAVEDITAQVAEKTELQNERTRLESLIYGTGAGSWEWNCQTGEVRVNEYWAAMIGRNLSTFHPSVDSCKEIIHPDDLAGVSSVLKAHFEGETQQYEVELRVKHLDGRWVWVLDRGRLITHTKCGKPEWMFGSRIDINERKLAEQALHRSEQLLAQTGRLANVGGWEADIATKELTWTDQTCIIHGVEPGYKPDVVGAVSYYAPEARPVIQKAVEKAIKDGEGWDLELPFIQANGNRIWVRAQGTVEYEGNRPARLVGALQDITERRQRLQELANAHERVTLATRSGNVGVWDWNITKDELNWSQEMFDLYDVDRMADDSVSYDLWRSRVHPDDREQAVAELRYAVEHQDSVNSEFKVLWRDGSTRYLRSTGNIKRDDIGNVTRVLGVNWDVTPLREMANEIAQQHELLRVTLQSIGDGVITTDANGLVAWMNPVAEQLTGRPASFAIGSPLTRVFNIIEENTRDVAVNPLDACLKGESPSNHDSQTLLISKEGVEYGIDVSAAPIRSLKDEILGAVLVFHDVTEARRLSEEMSYRATHDSLTNLNNRSEFESRLQATLDKSQTQPCDNALMYIDLDQFKLVNDTCGHTVGDQLLKQISGLLRQCIRGTDTLARLGGDEFGVILEDCSTAGAKRIAQRMCESVDEFRFEHNGHRFRIGASIGLIPFDGRWESTAAAMQAADLCCYTAKESGRNRVHEWYDTDEKLQARKDDLQWASRLEQALDDDKFELYVQRIHAVAGHEDGIHAEVLIRLGSDDGLIMPNVFLPAAERFHLASRIDRWVLQHSIDHLLSMKDVSGISMLCINLSGQSVSDSAFHREAIALLTEAGIDVCQRICVEITETVAVTNIADATNFVEKIRALGVRVALDDFGAGASSFGYLKMLDVDILKIDGQFITGMIDDKLDAAAVRCFVDVAAVLGIKTVAEFVKSAEIFEQIKSFGINYAQGYLIHKPEPIESVLIETPLPVSELCH